MIDTNLHKRTRKPIKPLADWCSIKAQGSELTIRLFGYIGQDESVNYEDFASQLSLVTDQVETITVIINSLGGEVFEGFAIYNELQRLKAQGIRIETEVYVAASMGGVVASAGDVIKINKYGKWMIHEAKSGAYGGVQALRAQADLVEKINNEIAELYAKRTGKDAANIKAEWMSPDKDVWFSPEEALAENIIDEIVEPSAMVATAITNATTPDESWKGFDKILNPTSKTMNEIQEIEQALANGGVTTIVVGASSNGAQLGANVLAIINAKDTLIAQLQQQIGAANEDTLTNKINTALDKYVTKGSILASERPVWENSLKNNFDATLQILEAKAAKINLENVIKPANPEEQQEEQAGGAPENRKNWDYFTWSKQDPKGLQAMHDNEPEKYKTLLAAVPSVK